jgi:hypothetical protein
MPANTEGERLTRTITIQGLESTTINEIYKNHAIWLIEHLEVTEACTCLSVRKTQNFNPECGVHAQVAKVLNPCPGDGKEYQDKGLTR